MNNRHGAAWAVLIAVIVAGFSYYFLQPQLELTRNNEVAGPQHSEAAGVDQLARSPSARIRASARGGRADVAQLSPRAAPLGNLERGLVMPGAISLDRSKALLASPDLGKHLEAFRAANGQNGDANDITALYQAYLTKSLAKFGRQAWLQELVCGQTVCIGVVRAKEPDSVVRDWSYAMLRERSLPIYGYVDVPVPLGTNDLEYRFVFSTDPKAAGLRFKPASKT